MKKSSTFVPLLGCGVMVTQQILVLLFMVRVRATQLKRLSEGRPFLLSTVDRPPTISKYSFLLLTISQCPKGGGVRLKRAAKGSKEQKEQKEQKV